MKKTKYLVLSAAAVLAVGCGGAKMTSIDEDRAKNVGDMIADSHTDLFDVTQDFTTIANYHDWKMKNLPHQVTVEQKETHHYEVFTGDGEPKRDIVGHNTRVLKYDVDAHRVSYKYDADFYYDAFYQEIYPGTYNYYVDFVVKDVPGSTTQKGLYCCSDWNGLKQRALGYFDDITPLGDEYCLTEETIDAFVKYAYVNASYFQEVDYGDDEFPLPSAAHYLVGRDDDAESAFNAIIDADFSEATVIPEDFEKWSSFVPSLVVMKDGYEKESQKFKTKDVKISFSSESAESDNSLASTGNFDLSWENETGYVFTESKVLQTYGVDYSFEYKNNLLTGSKVYGYTREDLLKDNKTTGFYTSNTVEKEVKITHEAKGFDDINLEDYVSLDD